MRSETERQRVLEIARGFAESARHPTQVNDRLRVDPHVARDAGHADVA